MLSVLCRLCLGFTQSSDLQRHHGRNVRNPKLSLTSVPCCTTNKYRLMRTLMCFFCFFLWCGMCAVCFCLRLLEVCALVLCRCWLAVLSVSQSTCRSWACVGVVLTQPFVCDTGALQGSEAAPSHVEFCPRHLHCNFCLCML